MIWLELAEVRWQRLEDEALYDVHCCRFGGMNLLGKSSLAGT